MAEEKHSGSWTLIRQLLLPYRVQLLAILAAMIVETFANLAAPWPLKVIIDDVAEIGRASCRERVCMLV